MFRAASCLIVLGVSIWLAACVVAPPVQEMSDARQAIAAAEQANAKDYAPQSLDAAHRYLAAAEAQIRDQSYGAARTSAQRAKDRAVEALETSQHAAKRDASGG